MYWSILFLIDVISIFDLQLGMQKSETGMGFNPATFWFEVRCLTHSATTAVNAGAKYVSNKLGFRTVLLRWHQS